MTPTEADVIVEEVTEEDLRREVRDLLAIDGLSEGELRRQAKAGDFASGYARVAWAILSDLDEIF